MRGDISLYTAIVEKKDQGLALHENTWPPRRRPLDAVRDDAQALALTASYAFPPGA